MELRAQMFLLALVAKLVIATVINIVVTREQQPAQKIINAYGKLGNAKTNSELQLPQVELVK